MSAFLPSAPTKSIDVSEKHKVPLIFLLDEEVTPHLFAEKIARACSGGALRPGEGVMVPDAAIVCFVLDATRALPVYGVPRKVPKKARQKAARRQPALMIVVKPLLYGQDSGTVRLELPSGLGLTGVVVEIDTANTATLLGVVLTAISEAGDRDAIEAARMLCRALLRG